MVKRRISFLLIIVQMCAVTPVKAGALRDRLSKSLSISGIKIFGYRSANVSGNEIVFRNQNYEIAETSVNDTSLTLIGRPFAHTTLTATVTDNRWGPSEGVYSLLYEGKRTRLGLGDINASVTGNQFASFNKRLRGVSIAQKVGDATFTAIASKTKSAAQTAVIAGNNSPGPYSLRATLIVDGSEHVRIDEQDIPRTDASGKSNYILDPYMGSITFRDGQIVSEGSTIYVSFETNSRYNSSGTIWGVRGDIPVSKRLGLGLTYLTQTPEHSTGIPSTTDKFNGQGPITQYYLRVTPLKGGLMKVAVDDVDQMIGYDYYVNYGDASVNFSRPIPETSVVIVTYTPVSASAVSVPRNVLGFDTSYALGKDINLSYQFAKSSADSYGRDGGSAMSFAASGKLNKLSFSAGLRDVAPNYAAIEASGLGRSEKGMDVNANYMLRDNLSIFTRFSKFRRPTFASWGANEATGYYSTTLSSSGFNYKPEKLPEVHFVHNNLSSSGNLGVSGTRPQSYDALTLRWSRNRFDVDAEFRSGTHKSLSDTSLGEVKTNTSRLSFRYLPGERLSLSGDLAGSRIHDARGVANASNAQFTASFQPFRSLTVTGNYRVADSGRPYGNPTETYRAAITRALDTGYGAIGSSLGNVGGQFLGGQTIDASYVGGGKTSTRTIGAQFAPNARLSVDGNLSYTYGEGDYTSNTKSSNRDFGIHIVPLDYLTINGRFSLQNMNYIGNEGNMFSKISFLDLELGPLSQFTLLLSYQDMTSTGSSLSSMYGSSVYGYDFTNLAAELSHPLGPGRKAFIRRELSTNNDSFASASNTTGQPMSNDRQISALGIEFALTNYMGLRADWRLISGNQGEGPANSYKASVPNIELRAQF